MGFDAEIDNSERNGVLDNLRAEIICSICCTIFEVLLFLWLWWLIYNCYSAGADEARLLRRTFVQEMLRTSKKQLAILSALPKSEFYREVFSTYGDSIEPIQALLSGWRMQRVHPLCQFCEAQRNVSSFEQKTMFGMQQVLFEGRFSRAFFLFWRTQQKCWSGSEENWKTGIGSGRGKNNDWAADCGRIYFMNFKKKNISDKRDWKTRIRSKNKTARRKTERRERKKSSRKS